MKITVAFDQWLERLSGSVTETSVGSYRFMFRRFAAWSKANHLSVERTRHKHIARWMEEARADGLRGGTVLDQLAIVRRVFEWAKQEGIIEENPVNPKELPRMRREKPNKVPFNRAEFERILNTIAVIGDQPDAYTEWQWWGDTCRIAWHTGLRMVDVCRLRWASVNFATAVLTVEPQKMRAYGQKLQIPIEPELMDCLEQRAAMARHRVPLSEFVLPHMAGVYLLDRSVLSTQFRRACDLANLPDHSFHSFRHGFVTRLLNAAVDPITIGSMTGQSIEQLAEYAHVSQQAKVAALERSRQALIMSSPGLPV